MLVTPDNTTDKITELMGRQIEWIMFRSVGFEDHSSLIGALYGERHGEKIGGGVEFCRDSEIEMAFE